MTTLRSTLPLQEPGPAAVEQGGVSHGFVLTALWSFLEPRSGALGLAVYGFEIRYLATRTSVRDCSPQQLGRLVALFAVVM